MQLRKLPNCAYPNCAHSKYECDPKCRRHVERHNEVYDWRNQITSHAKCFIGSPGLR